MGSPERAHSQGDATTHASCFLEAYNLEEHPKFEWGEAFSVDLLAGENTPRGVQSSIDAPSGEVGEGAESDGTNVGRHGEGDPGEASTYKLQLLSGGRSHSMDEWDLHSPILKGIGDGGEGAETMRESRW
jgi:hypothetical protein